jgi:hypothetical protein
MNKPLIFKIIIGITIDLLLIYNFNLINMINLRFYTFIMPVSQDVKIRYHNILLHDYNLLFKIHIISSMLWMLLGTYLISTELNLKSYYCPCLCKKSNRYIHRILGYLYVIFSMISAFTSIPCAYIQNMNCIIKYGSIFIVFIYFYSIINALIYIKNKRKHMYYMIISFSTGIGSVLMRPLMGCVVLYVLITKGINMFDDVDEYEKLYTGCAIVSFSTSILIAFMLKYI